MISASRAECVQEVEAGDRLGYLRCVGGVVCVMGGGFMPATAFSRRRVEAENCSFGACAQILASCAKRVRWFWASASRAKTSGVKVDIYRSRKIITIFQGSNGSASPSSSLVFAFLHKV